MNQKGFTLIELIAVIVILGALAAVAIPKFVDLTADAQLAGTRGIAGALGSASGLNYAAKVAGKTATDTTGGCSNTIAQTLLPGNTFGALPLEYSITTATFTGTPAVGDTLDCTVTNNKGSQTATFALIYVD